MPAYAAEGPVNTSRDLNALRLREVREAYALRIAALEQRLQEAGRILDDIMGRVDAYEEFVDDVDDILDAVEQKETTRIRNANNIPAGTPLTAAQKKEITNAIMNAEQRAIDNYLHPDTLEPLTDAQKSALRRAVEVNEEATRVSRNAVKATRELTSAIEAKKQEALRQAAAREYSEANAAKIKTREIIRSKSTETAQSALANEEFLEKLPKTTKEAAERIAPRIVAEEPAPLRLRPSAPTTPVASTNAANPAAAEAATMLRRGGKALGAVGLVVTGYDVIFENSREYAVRAYMDAVRECKNRIPRPFMSMIGDRLNRGWVVIGTNFGLDDIGDAITQGDFSRQTGAEIARGMNFLNETEGCKDLLAKLANDIEFRKGAFDYGVHINLPKKPKTE